MLHPRRSAQEILLCDLCEAIPLQSHCELCHVNLCKACVGEHLSDSSIRHKVVPFKQRKYAPYPKCSDHKEKHCELHCEKCDIPVCITCVTSGQHKGHDISDVLEKLSSKTESLQNDLEELETRIHPQYQAMVSDVQTEKSELDTNYRKLTEAADQQGEILHQEVTAIINQRKSAIQEMKKKHLSALNKNTEKITQKITELEQIISDLKSILESTDVSLTFTYKSRNSEFKSLPPRVRAILPRFSSGKINKDQLNEMFGSLSSLSINKEHGDALNSPVSSPPVKSLLDEPRLIATIDTEYDRLKSVSCLSEKEVWTCGNSNIMKLFNLQGELLTSIETSSGHNPWDIAVTRDRDLVYADVSEVKLVENEPMQGGPCNLCSTSTGDLLVIIEPMDFGESYLVRYRGFTERETIGSFSDGYHLYICENRNRDICVADCAAQAVVVLNQSGKLRFRYTGHLSNTTRSFDPVGITTDSQSHILIADCVHDRIHILDQDGQFLRYIQNCDLRNPWGLCVDAKDNLFVAEFDTAKVKKIQYLY